MSMNTSSQKQQRKKYFRRTTITLLMHAAQMPEGKATSNKQRYRRPCAGCQMFHHNELHFQVSRMTKTDAARALAEKSILLANDGEPM